MSRPHPHDKKHDSFMSVIIGTVVVAPGIPHWSPTRVTGPIRKRQRLVSVEMSKYSANILRESTPNLGVQREEKPQTQHKQETQTLGCSTLQIQTHRHLVAQRASKNRSSPYLVGWGICRFSCALGDPRASLPLQERMLKGTTALDTQKRELTVVFKDTIRRKLCCCVAARAVRWGREGGREGDR